MKKPARRVTHVRVYALLIAFFATTVCAVVGYDGYELVVEETSNFFIAVFNSYCLIMFHSFFHSNIYFSKKQIQACKTKQRQHMVCCRIVCMTGMSRALGASPKGRSYRRTR